MDLLQNISYYWTKKLDPRVANQPFVASFYQIPLIIFAYLYFVLEWGPKFMKNRSPYNLKTFMQLYNIIQIFMNTWLIYEAIDADLFSKKIICPVLNYSYDDFSMKVIRCGWIYFMLKIFDLIETGVFVLRKKKNQVSNLHLYHHVSVVFISWLTIRYYCVTFITIPCVINCFIHVVMYTYYFLSTCGPNVQKIVVSIKRWITVMQLVQFIMVMLYILHPLILRCKVTSNWIIIILIINLLINFFNFLHFYIQTYEKKKKN
ncbi:elongation of very long chain fatty acids protein 7 [Solenopsis invicta]|uniref:elongation of very long chain fatty acids protein 7 n=1 Tax=Solenopsis invicta TaxID=13686 RepID=UPI00193EAEDC|nr:elongation of very long chain fatty acids protein 7 [Solenopsis invicta]